MKDKIKELFLELKELRNRESKICSEIYNIQKNCIHNVIPTGSNSTESSGICSECGKDTGWYCPDNPSHICQYDEWGDYCLFCNQPNERK